MKIKRFPRRNGERGQAFMELAISVVFLLILLAAVIDLGWAFYTLIALRDAATEAASYGSMYPCKTNVNTVNDAEIRARFKSSTTAPIKASDIADGDVIIKIVNPSTGVDAPAAYGNSVRVTATIWHQIMTPFVGNFIGNNWRYPLTVTVSDTILRDKCK